MSESANTFRLRVNNRVVTVKWDFAEMRGEMLDAIEDYLGVSVYAWIRRWQQALVEGVRLSEFRSREIIALVFLGMYQEDPETTLQHVARSVAPYAIELLSPDEDPKPAMQGPPPAAPEQTVDPDGHRNVPSAFVTPTTSPTATALGATSTP